MLAVGEWSTTCNLRGVTKGVDKFATAIGLIVNLDVEAGGGAPAREVDADRRQRAGGVALGDADGQPRIGARGRVDLDLRGADDAGVGAERCRLLVACRDDHG